MKVGCFPRKRIRAKASGEGVSRHAAEHHVHGHDLKGDRRAVEHGPRDEPCLWADHGTRSPPLLEGRRDHAGEDVAVVGHGGLGGEKPQGHREQHLLLGDAPDEGQQQAGS